MIRNDTSHTHFVGSFDFDVPTLGLPEVAFVGRSNVGKSSALNCLLGMKKAARVSSRPGRTQRINLFQIKEHCVFTDLPGYGFAHVPAEVQAQWKDMIGHYLSSRETLKLVVVLVDARRDPQELDGTMLFGLAEAKIPCLVVATKADKLKRQALQKQMKSIRDGLRLPVGQPIAFSSASGAGKGEVWDVLERVCEQES